MFRVLEMLMQCQGVIVKKPDLGAHTKAKTPKAINAT